MKRLMIPMNTPLPGLVLVQRQNFADGRGEFSRLFCTQELLALGWSDPVAQSNYSYTARKGSVRGLHYQTPPHAEDKFVTCIRGEIFDVAVDLRRGSPTFLKWHGEVLSGVNHRSLLIPKGFAHGFQALTNDCDLIYMHSQAYVASAEAGLPPQDALIGIDWPLPVHNLSQRDSTHPALTPSFAGI